MEWLAEYPIPCRFTARHVSLELAHLLADSGNLAGISLLRSLYYRRVASGAFGKKLLRGSSERASNAIGSAFPFQCAEHDLIPGGAGSEACARDDRASGRPSPPFARIERQAGSPAGGRDGLSGTLFG